MQAELLVCKGNVLAIPSVVPCFGSAEKQDRATVGIEGKEYAHWITFELDSQLLLQSLTAFSKPSAVMRPVVRPFTRFKDTARIMAMPMWLMFWKTYSSP